MTLKSGSLVKTLSPSQRFHWHFLPSRGPLFLEPQASLMLFFKILIALCLIPWTALGVYLVVKYRVLFGPNPEHLSETPGARTFGIAQIASVWVGGLALGIYFLTL